MSKRIHHATAKKAKKFGITLEMLENEFNATKDGKVLASHASASVALEAAIAKLGGDKIAKAPKAKKPAKAKKARKAARSADLDEVGDDEDGDSDDEDHEGASIVKRKYKVRYKPFKMTCGDDLAQLVAKHIKVEGEDGKLIVDEDKLKTFAVANACWVADYRNLNVGMRRMNIVNRLRARVRKGEKVKWA